MPDPDSIYIQSLFNRLAKRYDLFNHLTSLGLATLWRKETLKSVEPGMRILDLGCGTGDLALGAIKKMDEKGEVVGLDFSSQMLEVAKKRYEKMVGNHAPIFRTVCEKAENLPIEKEPYDMVLSGFVLRNLYENIQKILSGVYASLKPGGKIRFLDFTEPPVPFVKTLWKIYMRTLVVLYGKILFGKDFPASYMTDSAQRFLKAPEFMQKLKEAGFESVENKSYLFGVIRLYQAARPIGIAHA